MFRLCLSAGCILLSASGCGQAGESAVTPAPSSPPQASFSYEKQVGIAGVQTGSLGCLTIFNDALQPGMKVALADQPPRTEEGGAAVQDATLVERLSEPCDDRVSAGGGDGDESYYRIRASGAEWQGGRYQYAIVDPRQPLDVREGRVAGDIDGDGTPEYFRNCASSEGVHYQVWTGVPPDGRGRWHRYVYAGYDLQTDCTEKDYFGPK